MSKTDVVRARIKPNLKKEVEKIFDTLGINSSQAINMFYNQVLMKKGLPFDVSIPNDETKTSYYFNRTFKCHFRF